MGYGGMAENNESVFAYFKVTFRHTPGRAEESQEYL
jgi:hypothetical protein